MTLAAPFPYFGGKRRIAPLVWRALGDTPNFVEPFAGSLAVLLGRPHAPHVETVNDVDCFVVNFFRALAADPEGVARWCDWPVTEPDVNARHQWLVDSVEFRERMNTDPDHYDVKRAGYWVYGICAFIGQGWCSRAPGVGVQRQLPHLGNAGRGVHRLSQDPKELINYLKLLATRLRRVRIACGDWSRVLTDAVTWRNGLTGIFLDPPYADGDVDYSAGGRGVSAAVAEWCREHGDDKRLRIVLAGYDGEHTMPDTWKVHQWRGNKGYAVDENENRERERLWLSPHCLSIVTQRGLLDLLDEKEDDDG